MAGIETKLNGLNERLSNSLNHLHQLETRYPPTTAAHVETQGTLEHVTRTRDNLLHVRDRVERSVSTQDGPLLQNGLSKLKASLSTFENRLRPFVDASSNARHSHGGMNADDAGSLSIMKGNADSCEVISVYLLCVIVVVVVPCPAPSSSLDAHSAEGGTEDRDAGKEGITLSVLFPQDRLAHFFEAVRSSCMHDDMVRERADCVIDAFENMSHELFALDHNWNLYDLPVSEKLRVVRGASLLANTLAPFVNYLQTVRSSSFHDRDAGMSSSSTSSSSMSGIMQMNTNMVVFSQLLSYTKSIEAVRTIITKVRNGIDGIAAELQQERAVDPRNAIVPKPYDVFVSHAGPDKLTVAQPLHAALKRAGLHSFLDLEELHCSTASAPDVMLRAMEEAKVGIFILSPEFAVRRWPMKELRRFLQRNKEADVGARPALVPVFFRLGVRDAPLVYEADSVHRAAIEAEQSGFFDKRRQAECSTDEARRAMQAIVRFSGIENIRVGGGEGLSTAAVVENSVRQVEVFMRSRENK